LSNDLSGILFIINTILTGKLSVYKTDGRSIRYSPIVGVETNGYKVKEFQSRWGSCTPRGRVDFNWKIIMAPNRVVDYVVVHELCHLNQHDHSPQFWKLVENIMPDYLECKEWLRVHGAGLMV
jgi:predicted metal-dependent hydrolase